MIGEKSGSGHLYSGVRAYHRVSLENYRATSRRSTVKEFPDETDRRRGTYSDREFLVINNRRGEKEAYRYYIPVT